MWDEEEMHAHSRYFLSGLSEVVNKTPYKEFRLTSYRKALCRKWPQRKLSEDLPGSTHLPPAVPTAPALRALELVLTAAPMEGTHPFKAAMATLKTSQR